MRLWATAAVLCLSSVAPLAKAGVPDPAQSSVDPCLVVCPAADAPFVVIVRDAAGNPVANSTVVIDFSYCGSVRFCAYRPQDPYVVFGRHVRANTNAQGRVEFPIRAGGVCGYPSTISADGVLLASRPTASFDQGGNGIVDSVDVAIAGRKLWTNDPTADFDCDGTVTQADLLAIQAHRTSQTCLAPFGVPYPFTSNFDACLVVCPLGDLRFHGEVRDYYGDPVVGSKVTLSFRYCSDVRLCPREPGDPYLVSGSVVVVISDAQGRVDIPLGAGGICATRIEIEADGVHMWNVRVASPDQDGTQLVDAVDFAIVEAKVGTSDETADFDCDFAVTEADLAIARSHDGHACERPVPARSTTWGRVKAIYR